MMGDSPAKTHQPSEAGILTDERQHVNTTVKDTDDADMELCQEMGDANEMDDSTNATKITTDNTNNETPSPPPPLHNIHQRLYVKDGSTGLIYPAIIRRSMWGPKYQTTNLGFIFNTTNDDQTMHQSGDVGDDEEEDDEESKRWNPQHNCHHYYVHYIGWNVKWDRWVEESCLYNDSKSTHLLAAKLMKGYNKVKPTKKGQRMSDANITKWMGLMKGIELEHRRLEEEGKLDLGDEEKEKKKAITSNDETEEDQKPAARRYPKRDSTEKSTTDAQSEQKHHECNNSTESPPSPVKKANNDTLLKKAQLRERGLQLKRKRSHSERLHLPFTLKRVLVDEWEAITKCGVVHDLPSSVTVRQALNRYLESKLVLLRKGDSKAAKGMTTTKTDERLTKQSTPNSEMEQDWIRMVDGIALFFDQALPVHLLFPQERCQYDFLRRKIMIQSKILVATVDACNKAKEVDATGNGVASATATAVDTESTVTATTTETPNSTDQSKTLPQIIIPERMSDLYGCEHLLRLFVRLPAVIATSDIPEAEARRIFSKLGDLVRFLQKYQSELFTSSFRRPFETEIRRGNKKSSV